VSAAACLGWPTRSPAAAGCHLHQEHVTVSVAAFWAPLHSSSQAMAPLHSSSQAMAPLPGGVPGSSSRAPVRVT
jgi:predicted NAD/FAD-dependent oxidoreductase